MSIPTYAQIGVAIAGRAATASVAGEPALALCTNEVPDQLGATPAVIVHPPEEPNLEWGPSGTLYSTQRWPVRFYRDQGPDFAGRMAALDLWRYAFLTAWVGNIQLGLHASGLDWAELRSIIVREANYAEQTYDLLDMIVEVRIRGTVAASA